MSILKFAASLLPRIGRDRIEEDIGLLITELNTVTIPALKLAQDSLGKGLKSKEGQAIEKQYRAYSRNPEKGSMIDSIRERIEASAKLLGVLQSHVEKGFEKDIFIAGLTLRKATALRLIEITSFASLYTLRLLNYLYIMEANTVGAEHYVTDNMSPGEIKRIKGHVYEFATALNAVGQPTDKAQKTLDTIPEVLVGPEFQSTVSAFGAGTVAGIWSAIPAPGLILCLAVVTLLLALAMGIMVAAGRITHMPHQDRAVLFFCGSTKSLASGLPIATAIFPAATVGATVLPVMIYHMTQLLVCSAIAQRMARARA